MRVQDSRSRVEMYSPVGSSPRIVGVVGARSLTYQHADHVGQIVDDLLARGNRVDRTLKLTPQRQVKLTP